MKKLVFLGLNVSFFLCLSGFFSDSQNGEVVFMTLFSVCKSKYDPPRNGYGSPYGACHKEPRNQTQVFSRSDFIKVMKNGISCKLQSFGEMVFQCDYNVTNSNCIVEGCRHVYIDTADFREKFGGFN